jgi:hypothetical protein
MEIVYIILFYSKAAQWYDCGVYTMFFALCTGFQLKMNNIHPSMTTKAQWQMLIHLLELAPADDNN